MIRAPRAVWSALTIAVGLLVSIAVTAATTGGASALLSVRAAVLLLLLAAAAGVLGGVVLAAVPMTDDERRGRLLDRAALAAAVWTVCAAATAFLLYLGEAPAPSSPAFGPGLVAFVADIPVGRTWLAAAAAAAVLTAVLVGVRSRRGVVALAVLSAAALVPVALQEAIGGAPIGVERTIASASFVQVVALLTWAAAAALGTPGRVLRSACFSAAGIATALAWPDLVAQGLAGPVVLAAGIAVLVAGVLAIASAVPRLPRAVVRLEALLLGAGLGLGAAGSVLRTSPSLPLRTTPAEILTGSPLPAAPSFVALLSTWRPDPLWVVVAAALLIAYVVALRGVQHAWPHTRTVSWVAGVVLLAWLTNGGPARYAEVDLGVHLAQHVALLLLVPLLLAGGAPARLLAAARPGATVPQVVTPPVAALLVVLALGALYGTGLLRWSVTEPLGTEVAAGGCLLLGAVLVHSCLEPGRVGRSAVVSAAALLFVLTAGAADLATGSSLLLPDWFGAMGWGTDALAAQRAGALAVWPVAAVPSAILLVMAIRGRRPAAEPLPRPVVAS